jgi:hypothetical protein
MNNRRALALCVALANMVHLRRWWDLLDTPLFRQVDRGAITTGMLLILTSIVILSGLGFTAFVLGKRVPILRPLLRWALFVVFTIGLLVGVGTAAPSFGARLSTPLLLLAGVLFLGTGLVWQRSRAVRRATCTITAASVLVLPLFVVQAIGLATRWPYSEAHQAEGDLLVESSSAVSPGLSRGPESHPRIVWMIFDELDQYLAFDAPGAQDRMPELSHFRAQSFYSGEVIPAHYYTQAAIPSMLNGVPLLRRQTFSGSGAAAPWNSPSNLFRVLQGNGRSVAILGSELNYCRLMGVDAARCYAVTRPPVPPHFFRSVIEMANYSGGTLGRVPIVSSAYWPIRLYFRNIRHGKVPSRNNSNAAAGNPSMRRILELLNQQLPEFLTGPYDFVYIHWPVPHPPGVGPAVNPVDVPDYLDNLTLADARLGNARRILEAAGLWDDSIVMVGSDHHYRLDYWQPGRESREFTAAGGREHQRIPLLIKMPRQAQAVQYNRPFNALLIHDLMLELAARRISSADQITAWLDRNRARFAGNSIPGE